MTESAITQDHLDDLVREARALDAEIKELTEKKSSLVERIKAELKVGDGGTVDGVAFSLRAGNRRFDAKAALTLMDLDVQVKCIVKTIDEKLVRNFSDQLGLTERCLLAADPTKTVFNLTS